MNEKSIDWYVIHCGNIIRDREYVDQYYRHMRIRIISYNGDLYWHEMCCGSLVSCAKLSPDV